MSRSGRDATAAPHGRHVTSPPPAECVGVAHVPQVDGRIDLDACLDALAPALLLESGDDGWSYVVPATGPVVRDDGHETVLSHGGHRRRLGTDPFAALDAVAAAVGLHPTAGRRTCDERLPSFTGGLVGAFAYDLGRRVERVAGRARRDRRHPDLQLWLASHVLAVSPARADAILVGRPFALDALLAATGAAAGPGWHEPVGAGRHEQAERDWHEQAHTLLARLEVAARGRSPAVHRAPQRQPVTTTLPVDDYLAAVERVLAAIAAGDVFQVNLTQRLTARWEGDTTTLYRALRRESRAAFGACVPALGIASVSPEQFLMVSGGTATTRPIKGTRPRAADPALDAALADDLATSVKDRAENVMVVDLERNDLGRVCVPGSVRVPELAEVEAHPTVWHLVSTVTGRLGPEVGYGRLLRAVFPCGSITGAPKVAAMGLIDTLEPVTRGWYCGAIGFLSVGAASLSVAIRTATRQPGGTVEYGAGGGIVADSDPQQELAECLDKAVPFLRAVAATGIGAGPGGAAAAGRTPAPSPPTQGRELREAGVERYADARRGGPRRG